jgi:hypothetical protein
VKLFCLILSVYVLLLSTKPCCSDNDCQAKLATKKELTGNKTANEKECPGCSPFFTCGSCVGFIVAKSFTISLPAIAEDQIKHHASYQQPHIEKVVLSLWLPPKIS